MLANPLHWDWTPLHWAALSDNPELVKVNTIFVLSVFWQPRASQGKYHPGRSHAALELVVMGTDGWIKLGRGGGGTAAKTF